MRATKKFKRTYYKYNLQDWTCPKATDYITPVDGGNMIISNIDNSDGNYEWKMLDGNNSTSWMLYDRGSGDDQKHRQRYITFPYEIFVTGLSFYSASFSASGGGIKTCRFYTDSTLSTPIGNTVNRPNGTTEITSVVEGIPQGGVRTNTIFIDITDCYVHPSNGVVSIISEIYITGKKYIGDIESTKDDYDYYKDVPIYKLPKTIERKYYKWVTWTQPVLTSNPQNGYSITGSNYSGDLKVLSDGIKNSTYISPTTTSSYGCVIKYNFPIKLKISKIKINGYIQTNVTWGFNSFKITGILGDTEEIITSTFPSISNDGWFDVEINVDDKQYTAIYLYCSGASSPHPRIGEITIIAEQPIESTQDDYDYYKDVPIYHGINQ